MALLQAGDKGLTKDELDVKSNHGDARGILKRLAKTDSDWEFVISFPGTSRTSTAMPYYTDQQQVIKVQLKDSNLEPTD